MAPYPRSKFWKPWKKPKSVVLVVAVPGPPPVSRKIWPNTWNESIIRRNIAMTDTGSSIGKMIRVTTCSPLAPSTRAASTTSVGMACSPASSSRKTSGVHSHTSMITTAATARWLSDSHAVVTPGAGRGAAS